MSYEGPLDARLNDPGVASSVAAQKALRSTNTFYRAPVAFQPFNGRQIAPQQTRCEFRPIVAVHELSPAAREKGPFFLRFPQRIHLLGNLVHSHEIVRVQTLDVLSALARQPRPCCGCSWTLYHDPELVRFAPAYGATFSRERRISFTNAFGGRRSGFGPRRKAQCRTRLVSCAFASQVRRSRA